jgi:ubiquitin-protein ligase
MAHVIPKRLIRDLKILNDEKEALGARGIYTHVNESDMTNMKILIVPRSKQDTESGLVSPYTGGLFLFEVSIPSDFPLTPPKVKFNPKQGTCRFHPNYYETGKVCLSVINTWAGEDWTPSMSLLSIINILEERFNERALCFEPGKENASHGMLIEYNQCIEYAKYTNCIIPIMTNKYEVYADFQSVLVAEFLKNYDHYMKCVAALSIYNNKCLHMPFYGYRYQVDTSIVKDKLQAINESLGQTPH